MARVSIAQGFAQSLIGRTNPIPIIRSIDPKDDYLWYATRTNNIIAARFVKVAFPVENRSNKYPRESRKVGNVRHLKFSRSNIVVQAQLKPYIDRFALDKIRSRVGI
jgi:hypothetical protein